MPYLEIPAGQKRALGQLMRLSDQERKSLLIGLREARPELLRRRFAATVSKKTHMDESEAEELIDVLGSLYVSMDIANEPVEPFVEQVVDAIKATGDKDLKPLDNDWSKFKDFLGQVLALDNSLGVTAKANEIILEYDHVFCTARILTDLRPVFGRDIAKGPTGAMIIHQARITYHEDGGEDTDDFFVTLNSAEIKLLKRLLDRAIRKEESLKAIAEKGDLDVLEA